MTVALLDVWPARATYHPGEPATLHVAMDFQTEAGAAPASVVCDLDIQLTWLHKVVTEWSQQVVVASGRAILAVPMVLPATAFRGYGVTVVVRDDTGNELARGSTAVDVLESWTQAPRYGFLVDFGPDEGGTEAEEHVATLARYHINVAQFYDWMWRHYALTPPAPDAPIDAGNSTSLDPDVFTDAMGRTLSLRTVRAKVAACRRFGIAALGYAAVYGAEREYAQAHPEEVVYDGRGEPYSLADLFYIMNIHTGNPWRERILATMQEAVRTIPFDGLHLDQYGFPVEAAFDAQGDPCDVAADFVAFINDARAAIQRPERDVRVIFNAVRNWPIELVAPTDQDAVYIEVWPPYEEFRHLQQLITQAQQLAPDKQVIIAAYMQPLGGAEGDALAQAEAATRLTSAAIWANGGFHLLLGEQNGALHDPYYVTYTILRPEFARVMRTYADFVVRYMNVLSDRRLRLEEVDEQGVVRVGHQATGASSDLRLSATAEAGTIWAIVRSMPGYTIASFINLTVAPTAHWNVPTPPPEPIAHLAISVRVRLDGAASVSRVYTASPDVDGGASSTLACTVEPASELVGDRAALVTFELPSLHYWSLVVIETGSDDSPGEEIRSFHA